MVDEFQDTSLQQYTFMHLIADKNVAVVGDDDQSIYSWRGANYQNITMFETDFPQVQEIRLEQNYRSTETILEAANGVISHNTNRKEKSLWSGNGSGKPIEIYMPENEADEADFIVETIQSICMTEKRKYDDFGILIRANTQSRALEEAFLENNIPYTMSGGTSFFQRLEIKDIISYLRVIANHEDDINLLRIINTPRRGFGRKMIELISEEANNTNSTLWDAILSLLHKSGSSIDEDDFRDYGKKKKKGDLDYELETEEDYGDTFSLSTEQPDDSPLSSKTCTDLESFASFIMKQRSMMLSGKGLSKKVKSMVEEINYFDYLISEYQKNEKAARFKFMNIESLINSIEMWENNPDNFDTGLYAYLNRITLLSRDDMDDEDGKGKINMMTIHASKGLEFPVVFIAGAEEGIIPHARSIEEGEGNIEEERRLFYVAITRARDKLYISSCRKRRRMQAVAECEPSRFLDEIPAHLVEYHEPESEVSSDKTRDILEAMKQKFSI